MLDSEQFPTSGWEQENLSTVKVPILFQQHLISFVFFKGTQGLG